MKSKLKSFLATLLTAAALLTPVRLPAQSTEALTSDQITKIRERIESLQEAITEATDAKNTSLVEIFLKASASDSAAIQLYQDCVREVEYDRLNQRGQDYREWERRNAERMREGDFATGLRIMLQYLAISIEAARADDLATVFPKLREYVDNLATLDEIPGGGLERSIANSVFARRYELEREFAERNETWEMNPLDIGGMYDKTILPYLRKESTERLMAAWDSRVTQERTLAEVRGDAALARFERETIPELKWARLKDQFVFENRVLAAAAMLEHIQENVGPPLHPKAALWLQEFAELMEMKDAIPSSGTPASVPPATDTEVLPPAAVTPFE